MKLKDRVLEILTETQKYTLLLLVANNYEAIKGKTHYQKELFLLSRNLEELKKEADFDADLMGPLSETADEELEQLEIVKVVEIKSGKIKLTDFGKEIAKVVVEETPKDVKKMCSDFKSLLNDLDLDELFGFIYFLYPEMTKESIKIEKLLLKREEIGLRLYLKDKISLEKSAEISGIPIELTKKIKKIMNTEI